MAVGPEPGSEWLYNEKRIRVNRVVARWSYIDPADSKGGDNNYEAKLHSFDPANGWGFIPAPKRVEVGKTYVRPVSGEDSIYFHVLEIMGEVAFGRSRYKQAPQDYWESDGRKLAQLESDDWTEVTDDGTDS